MTNQVASRYGPPKTLASTGPLVAGLLVKVQPRIWDSLVRSGLGSLLDTVGVEEREQAKLPGGRGVEGKFTRCDEQRPCDGCVSAFKQEAPENRRAT